MQEKLLWTFLDSSLPGTAARAMSFALLMDRSARLLLISRGAGAVSGKVQSSEKSS